MCLILYYMRICLIRGAVIISLVFSPKKIKFVIHESIHVLDPHGIDHSMTLLGIFCTVSKGILIVRHTNIIIVERPVSELEFG